MPIINLPTRRQFVAISTAESMGLADETQMELTPQ